MRFHQFAVLGLALLSVGCGQREAPAGAATVIRTQSSGPVSPPYQWTETITINDHHLTLVRIGGANVVGGTWEITLSDGQAAQVATDLTAVDAADADVPRHEPMVGGRSTTLTVNGTLAFHDDGSATFAHDVATLSQHIDGFIEPLAARRITSD